jgi:hypothetical protein
MLLDPPAFALLQMYWSKQSRIDRHKNDPEKMTSDVTSRLLFIT